MKQMLQMMAKTIATNDIFETHLAVWPLSFCAAGAKPLKFGTNDVSRQLQSHTNRHDSSWMSKVEATLAGNKRQLDGHRSPMRRERNPS